MAFADKPLNEEPPSDLSCQQNYDPSAMSHEPRVRRIFFLRKNILTASKLGISKPKILIKGGNSGRVSRALLVRPVREADGRRFDA